MKRSVNGIILPNTKQSSYKFNRLHSINRSESQVTPGLLQAALECNGVRIIVMQAKVKNITERERPGLAGGGRWEIGDCN